MAKTNPKAGDPRQISVRLPPQVYDGLRRNSYELHKSQTKIIVEALILYDDLAKRRKAATARPEVADAR